MQATILGRVNGSAGFAPVLPPWVTDFKKLPVRIAHGAFSLVIPWRVAVPVCR